MLFLLLNNHTKFIFNRGDDTHNGYHLAVS